MEPEPLIMITKFGESSVDIEVRVWIQRNKLFDVRSELITGIKTAFDEASIEIPFPHRTVYFGKDKSHTYQEAVKERMLRKL